MKIRTDFVTNSSSSNFTLSIFIGLKDEEKGDVMFHANGGTEQGRVDYFWNDATVTVSPKQLGEAKSVDELIELLRDGVIDGWDASRGTKIFEKSEPWKSEWDDRVYDAYDFIKEIKENIKSMDDIYEIYISGVEENGDLVYHRCYNYDMESKKYTGKEEGYPIECDGSGGGDLRFSDLDSCTIERKSDDE